MTERLRPNPRNPVHLLACGLGSGLVPFAPGTTGSLAGVALHLAIVPLSLAAYVLICVVVSVLGIWISGRTAHDLGVHDHPAIVIDEVAGMLIALIAAPPGWPWLIAGFVVFRVLDILKPWPIRALDRGVPGGLGIMLDDIAAGLTTLAVLQLAAAVL